MRLFVAVQTPLRIREKIAEELLPEIPAGKFRKTPEENLHITLCFIGERGEDETGLVQSALEQVKAGKFTAVISGAGSFDGRVIWIGVKEGQKEFEELANKVQHAIGISDGEFHAHITLCRNRNATSREFGETVEKLKEIKFTEKFEVNAISLMKSTPTQKSPVYEEISHAAL